jgi:hypothetical protein
MEELMNDQMNAPMSPEPAGVAGWFSTWMTAVTKPNEQTFVTMAEHPDAMSSNRAFTWVFLAGTISALISGVLQAILQLAGFVSQTPGLSDLFGGNAERGVAFTFGVAICSSPIAGALGVLFFAISVGIVQWVAKMFKGTGTFSQLAYTMAAVSVPFTLVSSLLTPFSGIPVVGICTGLASILFGLYALVLEIMAVKGVNKFGWGEAIGSLFLPGIVLVCCLSIFTIAALRLLGPAIGDTFSSINNSLP